MDRRVSKATTAWEKAQRLSMDFNLLKQDGQLNIQVVCQTLWRSKDKPDIVEALADLLTSEATKRSVFDGLEFFLPQLVQMMLHLDIKWNTPVLEQFILMVSQQNLHFALNAYLEVFCSMLDVQPELLNGTQGNGNGKEKMSPKNSGSKPDVFIRCASILDKIERAVVYGCEIQDLEAKYVSKEIGKEEFGELKRERQFEAAKKLIQMDTKPLFCGAMLFKANVEGREKGLSKIVELVDKNVGWKDHYFEIRYSMLLCFDVETEKLLKAVSLRHCKIFTEESEKYKHFFEIIEEGRTEVLQFRLPNKTVRSRWIKRLQFSKENPPLYSYTDKQELMSTVSRTQLARFTFFKDQFSFLQNLGQLTEEMHFKISIPELSYNPLVHSSETFQQLVAIKQTRCLFFQRDAALLAFDTKELFGNLDVANALNDELSEAASSSVVDNLTHSLIAPLAKIIAGAESAKNYLVSRPNFWEDEGAETNITSLARLNLPQTQNELFLISKRNQDLRLQGFVMQLFALFQRIWKESSLGVKADVRPVRLLSTSNNQGLSEVIRNAKSLEGIQKDHFRAKQTEVSLLEHFKLTFPEEGLSTAQKNFCESLAGYFVASYILDIRNRNLSNTLLDNNGSLIFINVDSVFGAGKTPFVIEAELEDVLHFSSSKANVFEIFVANCVDAFVEIRKNAQSLADLIELTALNLALTPLKDVAKIVKKLKKRLMNDVTEEEAVKKFINVLAKSTAYSSANVHKYEIRPELVSL